MAMGLVSLIHALLPAFLARVPDKMFRHFVAKASTRFKRVEAVLASKGLD